MFVPISACENGSVKLNTNSVITIFTNTAIKFLAFKNDIYNSSKV